MAAIMRKLTQHAALSFAARDFVGAVQICFAAAHFITGQTDHHTGEHEGQGSNICQRQQHIASQERGENDTCAEQNMCRFGNSLREVGGAEGCRQLFFSGHSQ